MLFTHNTPAVNYYSSAFAGACVSSTSKQLKNSATGAIWVACGLVFERHFNSTFQTTRVSSPSSTGAFAVRRTVALT